MFYLIVTSGLTTRDTETQNFLCELCVSVVSESETYRMSSAPMAACAAASRAMGTRNGEHET